MCFILNTSFLDLCHCVGLTSFPTLYQFYLSPASGAVPALGTAAGDGLKSDFLRFTTKQLPCGEL